MTAEIGNTELHLRFSFAAVITLMLLFCEEKIVLMSLLSSFIHESGHLLMMKQFGDRIFYIELGLFGMRIEKQNTLLSYKKEALIAMGGIILNLVFFCLFLLTYLFTEYEIFLLFSFVNGVVAAVNMLPVKILDFGRFLHLILLSRFSEEKSERIINSISVFFTLCADAICLLYCLFIKVNISLVAVALYLNIITFKKKWS